MDGYKNCPEKVSMIKLAEDIPSGFLMSTISCETS